MVQRTAAGSRPTSSPAIVAHSRAGGRSVMSILMVVVFPAPFGPIRPKTSSVEAVIEGPSTAVSDPNRRVRFRETTAGTGEAELKVEGRRGTLTSGE